VARSKKEGNEREETGVSLRVALCSSLSLSLSLSGWRRRAIGESRETRETISMISADLTIGAVVTQSYVPARISLTVPPSRSSLPAQTKLEL